ncbi:hypothetical protein JTB14_029370 [Gonioctena quinquepunctata]|nr:hypothetical protein JTB14_029370 [Gonioctena quinquepunctata]
MDLNAREDSSQVVEGVADTTYRLRNSICDSDALDGLDVETSYLAGYLKTWDLSQYVVTFRHSSPSASRWQRWKGDIGRAADERMRFFEC